MIKNNRIICHPGIYVKDAIEELGLSQSEFAFRTGLSIKNVSTLINGESNITFDVAVKLAAFFHNDVEGWINLQTKYNIYLNEEDKQKEYEKDWEIAKTFDKEFVASVLGIIIDSKHKKDAIDNLRNKFIVVSLENLKNPDMYAFCRTSVTKDISDKTIIMRNAWISLAEEEARKIKCILPFNKERILNNLDIIRSFTLKGLEGINEDLKYFLEQCGVKFVILPFLPGSNLSGVTKWIANENNVMIAVNDYGKDADKIWFSIMHEIGHAIKNHKRHLTISYSKNNIEDQEEIEANEFAENALIDKDKYADFIKAKDFSLKSIQQFAKMENVADFIVIGRLQKDGLIGWEKYIDLKPKLTVI